MTHLPRRLVALLILLCTVFVVPVSAQEDVADDASPAGSLTLYTSVTEDTIDAVLGVLAEQQPGLEVSVFRAPTGELDARIAAERRSGGVGADVLWLSDPLSMQRYDADGLLQPLSDEALGVVAPEYRSPTFVGTRLLNLIIVTAPDLDPQPVTWADLADPAYADAVVLPDPGFAGSAFAALGYVATAEGLGMDFYQGLRDNGAVQVPAPGDVLTAVAEGRYAAGITLDKIVRDAITAGSPIELVWPEPGAIAIYSPVAIVASTDVPAAAQAFVETIVSPEAQAAIAATGWQPVRGDVPWPHDGPVVAPDWQQLYGSQQQLMESYRAIFGD